MDNLRSSGSCYQYVRYACSLFTFALEARWASNVIGRTLQGRTFCLTVGWGGGGREINITFLKINLKGTLIIQFKLYL